MKRIEKKRIRKKTDTPGVVVDIVITVEQVLVDDVPMAKVTVDWNNSGRPQFLASALITIRDGAETTHAKLPANTATMPNGNPTTWQDYFGWWRASGNADGAEVEELSVEV